MNRHELWQQYDRAWRRHANAKRYERIFKVDASDDDDIDDRLDGDGNNGDSDQHVIDRLADWLVEAGDGEVSRAAALNWLLHDERGQALIRMTQSRKRATNRKGTTPMDSTSAVVKIAKAFADSGRSFMSETELTQKIFEYAQRDRLPHESEQQAFARVFSANSSEGMTFRKAIAVCKTAAMRPLGDDDGAAAWAYRKLEKLAERERARHPHLTPEQAFAKCFTDPANKALADQAHQRPVACW
jgi:hypothetical protein